MKLNSIVNESKTKAGRIFDLFIQSLIILSLVSFTIETLPNLSESTKLVLRVFEVFSVIIFTAEYILRIVVAPQKIKFIFSFYGLIDLFAILPFYVSTGIDLRSIRIFRLLRLFRVFKILRFSNAAKRFQFAVASIKSEIILFLIATLFVLYVSSVGIYYFENEAQPEQFASILHCFWWAIVTLTTVGYGDIYPITLGGRIFTGFIMIVGLGIVAVQTGLFAAALSKTVKDEVNDSD